MSEQQYGPLADRIARKYGVDPRLFRRLITAESGWNPNAASGAGARGLTQVVPRWHPNADLSTPQSQLDYGAKHLSSLLKKYGNPRDALSVYNSGRPWSVGQGISETNNYVTRILSGYGGSGSGPQSGGNADPGASLPAPGSPPSGQLDARRLMGILNATRQRVLRGEMPGPNYQSELQKLAAGAVPRGMAVQGAKQVGTAAVRGGAAFNGPLDNVPAQSVAFGADPQGDYDWAQNLASRFGLTVSSTYRNPSQQIATGSRAGLRSRHLVKGGAADISGSPAQMKALAEWAIRSGMFAEVFYDPVGQWDNGRFSRQGIGGHGDHVHLSYGKTIR